MKKQKNMRMEESVLEKAKLMAKIEGMTETELIEKAIEKMYLDSINGNRLVNFVSENIRFADDSLQVYKSDSEMYAFVSGKREVLKGLELMFLSAESGEGIT